MLFTWLCNARHSFLSISHLVFDFVHKFCCVTSHDEIFGICLFLVIHCLRFPRSIVNRLSVPCGMRISAEKRFFTMKGNLLQYIPRSFLRFPWSIVLRSSTFPLLRRPRIDHNPLLNGLGWWRFPQVSLIYRHLQQIFQDFDIHTRSSPGLMKLKKTRRRHPRGQIHRGSRFGCDTFFSWSLLSSFCQCSGASCRAEVVNVKQIQQMIPLITCEIPFG